MQHNSDYVFATLKTKERSICQHVFTHMTATLYIVLKKQQVCLPKQTLTTIAYNVN